jgi:hypothetical protein
MNRRTRALTLIVLLLGGHPARPALGGAAPRAWAEICSPASAAQLEALCASLRRRGLEARPIRVGRNVCVEIAAGSRGELNEAWRALRQAAGAAGMKVQLRPGAADEPSAIAARGAEPEPSRGARGPLPPVALLAPPGRTGLVRTSVFPAIQLLSLAGGQRLSPARLRGPPA